MSKQPIRIGVVGAGDVALRRIPALQKTEGICVIAICRRTLDKLERMQKYFGVPKAHTDWRQMLEEASLDAALISTPHDQHVAHVLTALEHRLRLAVDKPLAFRSEDAWRIVDAARRVDRTVMTLVGVLGSAAWQGARKALKDGAIGALRQIVVSTSSPHWGERILETPEIYATQRRAQVLPYSRRQGIPDDLYEPYGLEGDWRFDPKRTGGGAFANFGLNHIHLALWLAGAQPVIVSALSERAGARVERFLSTQSRLSNGVLLTNHLLRYPGRSVSDALGVWRFEDASARPGWLGRLQPAPAPHQRGPE